jgi:hypothetical protein
LKAPEAEARPTPVESGLLLDQNSLRNWFAKLHLQRNTLPLKTLDCPKLCAVGTAVVVSADRPEGFPGNFGHWEWGNESKSIK